MDDNRGHRSDNESLDGRVAELGASQCSVFSRQQALDLGFTAKQIRYRLVNGRWTQPLPRVYAISGSNPSGRAWAMAATLWAGATSLVSHATAAVLWGVEGVRTRRVEIWTPRSLESDIVVVHRGTRIDRADRTMLGPIPITTPVRTLIDLSPRFEDDALAGLVESTIRSGLVDPDRLRARLRSLRSSGRAGAGRLEAILDRRSSGPAMESALEVLVWSILVRSGVRLPDRQVWVVVPGGRYRLDFAWTDVKVALECDGFDAHASTRDRFGKDRARYAELVSSGYRVLPVTWDVARREPDRMVRWLHRTLALAA
jgi:very-short-patch-repair endonuclease